MAKPIHTNTSSDAIKEPFGDNAQVGKARLQSALAQENKPEVIPMALRVWSFVPPESSGLERGPR
jgi:hypothetical protein